MAEKLQPLSSLVEKSSVGHLLIKAEKQHQALDCIRHALCQSGHANMIAPEDILSCEVQATMMILTCQQASKATTIKQSMPLILPALKQQYPDIFHSVTTTKILLKPR